MANFFQSVSRQFGRQSNKDNKNSQQKGPTAQNASPNVFNPPMPALTSLPAVSSSLSLGDGYGGDSHTDHEPTKFFFREKHATNFILKGNFMTLAAQPKHVEVGEWLAHQIVEQNRLLTGLLQCIQEIDSNTGLSVCSPRSCPTMSAGRHTYTWLNNDKTPIKVPACQYIGLVQKWIVGKIHDTRVFPTDSSAIAASTYASGGMNTPGSTTPIAAGPTTLNTPLSILAGNEWVGKPSGFPESFLGDCKNITRQMFRCYAHLYHAHWENPFYHLAMDKQLNSCFVHFMTVAMLYKLLSEKDMEPMQPLIDIWLTSGAIPPDAAAGAGVLGPAIPS